MNDFCDEMPDVKAKSWLNQYRIEGLLGRETLKHEMKGRVTVKADFGMFEYNNQFFRTYNKIPGFQTARPDPGPLS